MDRVESPQRRASVAPRLLDRSPVDLDQRTTGEQLSPIVLCLHASVGDANPANDLDLCEDARGQSVGLVVQEDREIRRPLLPDDQLYERRRVGVDDSVSCRHDLGSPPRQRSRPSPRTGASAAGKAARRCRALGDQLVEPTPAVRGKHSDRLAIVCDLDRLAGANTANGLRQRVPKLAYAHTCGHMCPHTSGGRSEEDGTSERSASVRHAGCAHPFPAVSDPRVPLAGSPSPTSGPWFHAGAWVG